MSKSSIIITIALVVIAALGYYFYAPDSWKFWGQTANVIDTLPQDTESVAQHDRITAKHQFKNGTHIIAGEANSPTPCDLLSVNAVAGTNPVAINFISQNSGEMCAQVLTTNKFKVEFQAPENATFKATWNGQPVELNLIPAGADEDLTNFEVFIKG